MLRRSFLTRLSHLPMLFLPWEKQPAAFDDPPPRNVPARLLLYSGWNMTNIGDQGHTPGTLRFLEQHWPSARVSLWLSTTTPEVTAMLRRRFSNIERICQGTIDATGQADNSDLQGAFDAADLVIHNSGMHYNKFWHPSPLLEACYQKQKKLCLYGQSFDGFFEKDRARMVKLLSNAAAIYCRDNESYYYLRDIGVQSRILEFGVDGCFGIDLANGKKASAFLQQHQLESKAFLAVVLRTNTPYYSKPEEADLPEWDNGDTTQNPWEPTEEDWEQTRLWVNKVKEIITAWVTETGRHAVLVPEVKKEIRYAKELIYDTLPAAVKKQVVHKAEWWNMDEACSFFRHSHTLVALEPHSCIMALAHGTPAIHLFSKRHGLKAWMFRDIGLPEWLYDIDEEGTAAMMRAVRDIHADYPRAQEKVNRAMKFVEQRSKEMVTDLKMLLS